MITLVNKIFVIFMRIAFLGTMGVPARYGGFETCVEEVATRLVEQGHEVIVYCGYRGLKPKMKWYKGIRLVYIPSLRNKFLDFPFRAFIATLDVLRRKVDIAHFFGSDAWPFTLMTRLMSIKTVLTLDGLVWKRSSYPVFIRRILLMTAGLAFYFPHTTIVDSKFVQNWYYRTFGKKPIYVPYGANVGLNNVDDAALIKKGLEKGKYVLFVGRFVKEKGIHYLIEAFRQIKTDFNLAIVGGDPYGKEYENYLKAIASKNTKFLGNVYGKECENLYAGAYLYVTSSDLEGTSPALLTAMALGKCVLVSDIPENLETIGDAGFSFKRGNVKDLRQKLQLLLTCPGLVEFVGRKAVERVNTDYNWSLITSQIENIYISNLYLRNSSRKMSVQQSKAEEISQQITKNA
jgi:glycosyltransferase involved in cell wall biosynthesis